MSPFAPSFAGIDVSKEKFDVALCEADSSKDLDQFSHSIFPRTSRGAKAFLTWSQKQLNKKKGLVPQPGDRPKVVMDATGRNSHELAKWLSQWAPNIEISIVNPYQLSHFRKSLGIENKTDKIDCKVHVLYGAERNPALYQPRDERFSEIRALIRHRKAIQDNLLATSLRNKEPDTPKSVLKFYRVQMRFLEKQILAIEKELDQIIDQNGDIKRDVRLLCTVPGIQKLTALTVLGELGDLRQFKTSRALSAMSGLAPRVRESGKKSLPAVISRKGSSFLRRALFMPCTSILKLDNSLGKKYRELREKGKPHKSALCAVMRKQLIIMRSILNKNEPFIKDYEHKRSRNPERPSVENPKKSVEKT